MIFKGSLPCNLPLADFTLGQSLTTDEIIAHSSYIYKAWYYRFMRYVALLRGINVGGNNKVAMPRLKQLFESLGFSNVRTYINSGNVLFTDTKHQLSVLTSMIESAIKNDVGFTVNVLVKDSTVISTIAQTIPAEWKNDTLQKTDVMFLWSDIDDANIMSQFTINPANERLLYCSGALIWNVDRRYITKGSVLRTVTAQYYKKMTIRNVNTLRKLAQLMAE